MWLTYFQNIYRIQLVSVTLLPLKNTEMNGSIGGINQYVLEGCQNTGPSDYENLNHKTEKVNQELREFQETDTLVLK